MHESKNEPIDSVLEEDELSDALSDQIAKMWAAHEKAPMTSAWEAKAIVHKELFGFFKQYTAKKCKEAREQSIRVGRQLTMDIAFSYMDGDDVNVQDLSSKSLMLVNQRIDELRQSDEANPDLLRAGDES